MLISGTLVQHSSMDNAGYFVDDQPLEVCDRLYEAIRVLPHRLVDQTTHSFGEVEIDTEAKKAKTLRWESV